VIIYPNSLKQLFFVSEKQRVLFEVGT